MLNPAYLTMQQSYPSIWINGFGKKKKKKVDIHEIQE